MISKQKSIKVPKELTHGPFAVDTGSLMLPGLIYIFLGSTQKPGRSPLSECVIRS